MAHLQRFSNLLIEFGIEVKGVLGDAKALRELATDDRDEVISALKAAGVQKVGQRIKLEQALRERPGENDDPRSEWNASESTASSSSAPVSNSYSGATKKEENTMEWYLEKMRVTNEKLAAQRTFIGPLPEEHKPIDAAKSPMDRALEFYGDDSNGEGSDSDAAPADTRFD